MSVTAFISLAIGVGASYGIAKVNGLLYEDAKDVIAKLTKENTDLSAESRALQLQLKGLVSPGELNRCEENLDKIRSNRNQAIHEALVDLKKQQDEDEKVLVALTNKKWKSQYASLTEADQITYNTATQRWLSFPGDRTALLKQLTCVP